MYKLNNNNNIFKFIIKFIALYENIILKKFNLLFIIN